MKTNVPSLNPNNVQIIEEYGLTIIPLEPIGAKSME